MTLSSEEIIIESNLRQRTEILAECEIDHEKRHVFYELCKKDILSFFSLSLFTYDPREYLKDIPFVPWSFQQSYIKELNQDIKIGESQLTEKSRDMGVTWMILATFLYRWLFFDESFLLGSRKEELVDKIGDMDSHFERLRYMIDKLPLWLLEMCGYDKKNSGYLKIYKNNGACLVGESMNREFSRQGRYKAILLDEFAFVEGAETVWRACGDSAPCKVVVSTPNGKNNFFAQLRESGKIKIKTVHWSLHPKKDEAWYQRQRADRTERDVAQEIDINYTVSAGTPFYGGFRPDIHVGTFVYNKDRELLIGWDFGYVHPAVVVTQLDDKDRWIILRERLGSNITIDVFADHIIAMLNQEFPSSRLRHFGDPACMQVNDKSEFTTWQILRNKGIFVVFRQSEYRRRKEIIEQKLHTLHDGKPCLMVDSSCKIFIEGFQGGYHYPTPNETQQVTKKFEMPFKDGYFDHCFNALEYIAVNVFSPIKATYNVSTSDKSYGGPRRVEQLKKKEYNMINV